MDEEVDHYGFEGRILKFRNVKGLFGVTREQSLLLATSALVEALGYAGRNGKQLGQLRALELCCGGGAVAITLKDAGIGYMEASDINEASLDMCRTNAQANSVVLDRVYQCDMLRPQAITQDEKFDMIICNFPCRPTALVPEGIGENMQIAIDGGPDGVRFLSALLRLGKCHLSDNGQLLFVLTSTMDVNRVLEELDDHFRSRWRIAYHTPVAQPFARNGTLEATRALELCRDGKAFVWERSDGRIWRLSWVIVASPSGIQRRSESGLWFCPIGFNVVHPNYLDAVDEFNNSSLSG